MKPNRSLTAGLNFIIIIFFLSDINHTVAQAWKNYSLGFYNEVTVCPNSLLEEKKMFKMCTVTHSLAKYGVAVQTWWWDH